MFDTQIGSLPVVTSLAASDIIVVNASNITSTISLSNFTPKPGSSVYGATSATIAGGVTGGVYTLATGTQETGFCGVYTQYSVTGQNSTSFVNFKTKLTNTPSSITLSSLGSANSGALNFAYVSVYGFQLYASTTTGPGAMNNYGNYVTVGN